MKETFVAVVTIYPKNSHVIVLRNSEIFSFSLLTFELDAILVYLYDSFNYLN